MPNILVIGATGTVGSQVVDQLLKRDVTVSALTRDPEKKGKLPPEVEVKTGNLQDPDHVRKIFDGIESVFMLNPVSPTETHEGLMGLNGAILAGVGHFVYMSVQDVDRAIHLPHFGSKYPIEAALKESDMAYTILRPNNFYQNDYWFRDALLEYGVYPQPIGNVGLSRVDVRDIADLAAEVLTTDGHAGKTYNVVGPEPLTGERTAEIWSEALGREIHYAGDDLEQFETTFRQYMPAWMVFDFRLMYAFFQKNGLKATDDDIEAQTRITGHPPRKFDDFARETAAMWKD